uniref:PBZ-type domain-containing protein n=1 Tax=Photinus pyralis TaxID=7054 RepID=A0A1Y1LH13_PHOPY
MISLEIYKLDCEDSAICTLNVGEHIFGRGTLLECDDKRVSRNHGLITITNEKASITSTHQNPCFYIYTNSPTVTILPRDSPVNITDGDKFALLADQFWYKLKINVNNNNELPATNAMVPEGEPESNNIEETHTPYEYNGKDDSLKRPHQDEPNSENKKMRTLNASELPQSTVDEPSPSRIDAQEISELNTEEQSDNIDTKQPNESDKGSETVADSAQNTTMPVATTSTSSNKRPWRDYCVYGKQCYRKSAAHFNEFSHPGDSDYESDPNDQRPTCSFGSDCYRKNKDHRKAYKHPRGMTGVKNPAGARKRFHTCNCAYCHINSSKKRDYESDHEDT